jgi:hypothetical protein
MLTTLESIFYRKKGFFFFGYLSHDNSFSLGVIDVKFSLSGLELDLSGEL